MTDVRQDSGELFPTTQGFDGEIIAPDHAVAGAVEGTMIDGLGDPGVEGTLQAGLDLKVRSQWSYARSRFFRHRLALLGLVGLVIIFGAGAFANYVAPYSFSQQNLYNLLQAPTTAAHHYFGTDEAGRDEFSRVIWGIRTSMEVGVFVAVVSTIIGLIIGAIAGYYGGFIDNILMRITDLGLTL